jgi:phosphatidylserine decarboxylase
MAPLPPRYEPHPLIAKEGWVILAIAFVVASALQMNGAFLAWPAWLFFLFALQFFRDPTRIPAGDNHTVLAPADGRVIAIEKTIDPIRGVPALKISIFMNVFNVHSNRSPIDGEVQSVHYFPGKFFNADLDKASLENERNALVIKHQQTGQEITCIQIAGLIARRIVCHVKSGSTLLRGGRFGFIRFGSRVDVYLPESVEITAMVGEKVTAALSIIAIFPRPEEH